MPSRVELKAGKEFTLPDKSIVQVQLINGKLRVYRNGHSLRELEHPKRTLRWSAAAFTFMGVADILLGSAAASKVLWPETPLISVVTILACGFAFLGVAHLARRRSIMAFIVGAILYASQTLLLQLQDSSLSFSAIFGIVHVAIYSVEGIQAIRKLSAQPPPP